MANKNHKQFADRRRGFTLVETLVSIALFSLIMTVIMQLFLYASRAHRHILAKSQIISEISYNLEHMSRGLRMAKKTNDSACLPAAGLNFEKTARGGIKFQNINAAGQFECVEYYSGHPIDYPAGVNAIMEYRAGPDRTFDLPLTSPAISVLEFAIAEYGWSQTDRLQPRATIHIKVLGKEGQTAENQITVSQRDLDIQE
jgi:prepilin-type N-terminal cleavage/methylation domain-containing protein